jgi:hypothetical protein
MAADNPKRSAVLVAALRQSEELFDAAAAVTAAAKPLLLFYGLSQAGRAITAARDPDASWKTHGHGLKVIENPTDIGRTTIKPDGGGNNAFAALTHALHSDGIGGEVELSAVWASIPELAHLPHLRRGALGALPLQPEGGGEPSVLSVLHAAHASALIVGVTNEADVDDRLNRYGRIAGYEYVVPPRISAEGKAFVTLHWPSTDALERPGRKKIRQLSEVALHAEGRWYLQPLIGAPASSPEPLVLWWLLLIGLSSLARYEPQAWTRGIDLDRTPDAAELQEALDIAERVVPELVLRELHTPRVRNS